MVQVRWDHLNRDASLLTKSQAIFLDGHFVIEHGSRNRCGRFMHFNGTAGVWRRDAIDDGGGWQHDTLTEDLDLSYRSQLKGWQFVYLPNHVAPAELPPEMIALQAAATAGPRARSRPASSCCRSILRSDQPLKVKTEAFFHLSTNFIYPLMCVLSVLMAPSMVIRYNMGWYEMLLIDVPLFLAATASVANFYMVCQRELYPHTWTERLRYLPFLMSIGIGLAVNNTKAVIEALLHKPSEFARTPKYRIEGGADEWMGKKYRQAVAIQPLIELALGLYFTATLFYALANGIYGTVPFLMLFQVGFLYTGLLSIVQQYGGDLEFKPVASKEARLQPAPSRRRGHRVASRSRAAPCHHETLARDRAAGVAPLHARRPRRPGPAQRRPAGHRAPGRRQGPRPDRSAPAHADPRLLRPASRTGHLGDD